MGAPKPASIDVVAAYRYNMMMNLTMSKSDLAKFMNCGIKAANKVWVEIIKDIENDGKSNIGIGNKVLTTRVMKKLGITRNQIIEDYERTNKKG